MKFQVLYMAYLGYEEKPVYTQISASSLDSANKKAKKMIDKLNSKHRGFYKLVKVKEGA